MDQDGFKTPLSVKPPKEKCDGKAEDPLSSTRTSDSIDSEKLQDVVDHDRSDSPDSSSIDRVRKPPREERDSSQQRQQQQHQPPPPRVDAPPPDFKLIYKEPPWSEESPLPYVLDVLKGGTIIDRITLQGKPYQLVGRVPVCDIQLENPSVSRQHAVFQHASTGRVYIRDLGSTHGTYIGKRRIRPHTFCVLRLGDCVRFGRSSRMLILEGPTPEVRQEMEEALEVATAYAKQVIEDRQKEDELAKLQRDESSAQDSRRSGVTWGMDDADIELTLESAHGTSNDAADDEDHGDAFEHMDTSFAGEEVFSGAASDVKAFLKNLRTRKKKGWRAQREEKKRKKAQAERKAKEKQRQLTQEELALMEEAEREQREKQELEAKRSYLYTFDDTDGFYDRTGKQTKRKKENRTSAKRNKSKPETMESLTAKKALLEAQKVLAEEKLSEMMKEEEVKASSDKSNTGDDALDDFMSGISSKQEKDKIKKQKELIAEYESDISKVDRLLVIVQPALERVGAPSGIGLADTVNRMREHYLAKTRATRTRHSSKSTAAALEAVKMSSTQSPSRQDHSRSPSARQSHDTTSGSRGEDARVQSTAQRVPTVHLEDAPPPTTKRQYYKEDTPSSRKQDHVDGGSKKTKRRKRYKPPVSYSYDDESDSYSEWVPKGNAQQL